MTEISLHLGLILLIAAFLCESLDSTLGMGYGTTMAPLLLLFGFVPEHIVPAILLSELVTGISSGMMHHREGNVNFHFKILNFQRIQAGLALPVPETPDCHTYGIQVSIHLKVVLILLSATLLGALGAVLTASLIPRHWISIYISAMVISMGVIMLTCFNREFRYSWQRIAGLGLLASFNKGLTGGGYGPLVVSGQILSGVPGKNAIGITSLAEGLTCALGAGAYILSTKGAIDWKLAAVIISGACLAIPLSARNVRVINPRLLKGLIAGFTIVLGCVVMARTLGSI